MKDVQAKRDASKLNIQHVKKTLNFFIVSYICGQYCGFNGVQSRSAYMTNKNRKKVGNFILWSAVVAWMFS